MGPSHGSYNDLDSIVTTDATQTSRTWVASAIAAERGPRSEFKVNIYRDFIALTAPSRLCIFDLAGVAPGLPVHSTINSFL